MCGEVVHLRQQLRCERLPVRLDPTHRDPAEPHAVIRAQPAHEARALRLAVAPVVGERDLERAVHRLRPRVREEDVVDPVRQDLHERVREREARRVPHLEAGRVVERARRLGDRLGDRRAAVARRSRTRGPRPRRGSGGRRRRDSACPAPRTRMRGFALNARFAVNGIQSASSEGSCFWVGVVNGVGGVIVGSSWGSREDVVRPWPWEVDGACRTAATVHCWLARAPETRNARRKAGRFDYRDEAL